MFKIFEGFNSPEESSNTYSTNKRKRRIPSLSNEVRGLVLSKIHYDNLKQDLLKESHEKNQKAIEIIREDYKKIKYEKNK